MKNSEIAKRCRPNTDYSISRGNVLLRTFNANQATNDGTYRARYRTSQLNTLENESRCFRTCKNADRGTATIADGAS
jgi:hypothetical protein